MTKYYSLSTKNMFVTFEFIINDMFEWIKKFNIWRIKKKIIEI